MDSRAKLLLVVFLGLTIFLFLFCEPAHAGFNFGYDTYGTDGGILILNSTGDQTTSSTLGQLGTNDFIGELAVKNELKLDGYTVAYDANNLGMNPQYAYQYNTDLPQGVALTELQFAGKSGDPRQLQNVYVLTSEYNRLSAVGQANSIDVLNNAISSETINRISGDNILQTKIDTESTQRKNGDEQLQDNIETETAKRQSADDKEKLSRIASDKKLNNEISMVNSNSIVRDNNLQNNINIVDSSSVGRDNTLQSNITTESNQRAVADNYLNSRINDTNNRIDAVSNRVSKLEGTQYKAQVEFRVYDSKYVTVSPYVSQDFTRSCIDEAGVRITVKIGKSYEEKLLEKTNARVNEIEKRIGVAPIVEKVVDDKGHLKSVSINSNGLAVNGQF